MLRIRTTGGAASDRARSSGEQASSIAMQVTSQGKKRRMVLLYGKACMWGGELASTA
ncbi:hypothetical protein [Solirubrum puertoriconensis]|uniref:hypothetical protein n=1 Tax=Solirubrum puertoriconensis TaxID=1751427 RepID=UPI00156B1FA2|nr:hypothetical protein [Solirubrum puertoriconensis]